MVKDTYALLTGLFVVTLGVTMVIMGFFLGDYGRERDVYIISTRGAVSGLNPESEVIYRGVKAGKVAAIGFDPNDTRTIFVRLELDKGLPITRGTYATLRVQPLTGLAQVELSDAGDDPAPMSTDVHAPAHIPLRPSLLDKLAGSGSDIMSQLTQIAQRLNDLLGEQNQGRIVHALEMLDRAVTDLVGLEGQLKQQIERIPALDKKLSGALEAHASAAKSVRETSERIGRLSVQAEDVMKIGKLAGTTLTTEQLPELSDLLKDLRLAAASIKKISLELERHPRALLFGPMPLAPGPGEPGYEEP